MPPNEEIKTDSVDQRDQVKQMEIRKNIAFMLSKVNDLVRDEFISDFYILEYSLEQIFKDLVTKA